MNLAKHEAAEVVPALSARGFRSTFTITEKQIRPGLQAENILIYSSDHQVLAVLTESEKAHAHAALETVSRSQCLRFWFVCPNGSRK